ncbi:hypothetical protein QYF36_010360 [Acer negundo]|nr:hypothetical protein QYF36_010360 [Acer negundo]
MSMFWWLPQILSKVMVSAVSDHNPTLVDVGFIIDEIKALRVDIQVFKCQAIPRSGNNLAHNLASMAISSRRS